MKSFVKAIFIIFLINFVPLSSISGLENSIRNKITGIIFDNATGKPLPGANVIIKGTTIGVATNLKGEFSFPKIEQGTYTLIVKFIGYKEKKEIVTLKKYSVYIEIGLDVVAIEGQEVRVNAQAKGQMDAINQQINSNTIKNIVSSDRLNEIPDVNAAESIGRLPGVAIVRNGGEATDIIIRGLKSKYATVSIDGVKMPSTETDRSVSIANISPNMLDGIELTKGITPDMDGDATAGAINFKLRQAPSGFKIGALLQGGYNNYDKSYGMSKMNLSFSNRFFNNKFGVFSQISFSKANHGTDTFQGVYYPRSAPNETNPNPPLIVSLLELGKNINTNSRFGFSLSADYSLPNGKLFLKNFSNGYISNAVSMVNSYNVNYKMMTPEVRGSSDNSTYSTVTSLAGEHKLWSGLLDWSASYSYTKSENPDWVFNPDGIGTNISHEVLLNGNNVKGAKNIPSFLENYDSENFTLQYVKYSSGEREAGEISSKVNMVFPYFISNKISGKVKFGGKYSRNSRYSSRSTRSLDLWQDTGRINALKSEFPFLKWNNFDRIILTSFMDVEHPTKDIFGGEYKYYFPIDAELSNKFVLDVKKYSREYLASKSNNYDNVEQYFAGYLMSTNNVTEYLTSVIGVRYERTAHDYNALLFRPDINNNPNDSPLERGKLEKVTSSGTRENWLAMFNIKYKPFNWNDIRLAITKSVKRPSYFQLSPHQQINLIKNEASLNNPKLKVEEAINIDLQTSFYGNYIGLISVGGFYKKINNLIYSRRFTVFSDSAAQMYYPELKKFAKISFPDNVPGYNTWVKGIEFEWQTRFWYLPFPFDGLVFNFNFSYLQSETLSLLFKKEKVQGTFPPKYIYSYAEKKTRIPTQIDYLGNISIGYDYAGFSTRITGLYTGPIYGINRYSVNNTTREELFRWDVQITQKMFDGFILICNINNITNWSDMRTNEYYGYIHSRQEYGWQGSVGIRYSFK